MKHTELLHSILEKSGAIQHKGRLKSVMAAVSSVMNGASLSLTSTSYMKMRHQNQHMLVR